jgi:hypothetical protein
MSATQEVLLTAACVSAVTLGVRVLLWRPVIVPERRRVAAKLAHLAATEPAHARVLALRGPAHAMGGPGGTHLLLEVYRPDRPAHSAVLDPHQAAESSPGHLIDVRVEKADPTIVYLPPGQTARGEQPPMHVPHRFLLTLPLALFAAGCQSGATLYMANPLTGAPIPPHQIVQIDRALEMGSGLPTGTLAHEATLAALDQQRVCFRVVLRVDGAHRQLADLRAWRAVLELPELENTSAVFFASATQQHENRQGVTASVATRSERVCDARGENCVFKDVEVRTPQASVVDVVTGGGEVCFPHGGQITNRTDSMTLALRDPASVLHRVKFTWSFQ